MEGSNLRAWELFGWWGNGMMRERERRKSGWRMGMMRGMGGEVEIKEVRKEGSGEKEGERKEEKRSEK